MVALAVATAATTLSCSNERLLHGKESVEVKFTGNLAQIKTRVGGAAGTEWSAGDPVGIYMIKTDPGTLSEGNVVAANKLYTASAGTEASFTPDGGTPLYYPSDGSGVKFIAYHPRSTSVSADYKVPVSVADQDNLSAIDVMYAPVTTTFSRSSTGAVPLLFAHKLTKLVFNISNGAGVTEPVANGITVSISDQPTTGTLDLADGSVEASAATGSVTATGGAVIEAIVMPMTDLTDVGFTFTNDAGQSFTVDPPTTSWQGGYRYTYTVTLKATDKESDISGEIDPWEDGGTTPVTGEETEAEPQRINLWANDTETSLEFTATGPWTANVTEGGNTRAGGSEVYWIELWSEHWPTYEGPAGEQSLFIELQPNFSGVERQATITIDDGNTRMISHVVQATTMENGLHPLPYHPAPDGRDVMLENHDGHGRAFAGAIQSDPNAPDMPGRAPDIFYPRALRGVTAGRLVYLRSEPQDGWLPSGSGYGFVVTTTGGEREIEVMPFFSQDGEPLPYFEMPEEDVTVQAMFVPAPPKTYDVTVTAGKGGNTVVNPAWANPDTDVEAGRSVRIVATPTVGYEFAEWISSGTPFTFDENYSEGEGEDGYYDQYDSDCYFIMPEGDVIVEATFVPTSSAESFPVTVTQGITGGLHALAGLDPSGTGAAATMNAREDDVVYFHATPQEGHVFTHWDFFMNGTRLNSPAWRINDIIYDTGDNPTAMIMPRADIEAKALFVPEGAVPFLGNWSISTMDSGHYIEISGNGIRYRREYFLTFWTIRDVVSWEPITGNEEYPTGYKIVGTQTEHFNWFELPIDSDYMAENDVPIIRYMCVYLSADGKKIKLWDNHTYPEQRMPNGIEAK